MERRFLYPGKTDIWIVPDDVNDENREARLRLLSERERSRYASYQSREARSRYLAGRTALKRLLSFYAEVRPDDWSIEADCYGQPSIKQPEWLSFIKIGISHAGGVTAFALTIDDAVGIDVSDRFKENDVSLAPVILSEHEMAAYRATLPADRLEFLRDRWTLKEAYTKALGKGHWIAFDTFAFDHANHSAIRLQHALEIQPIRWQFRLFNVGELRLALAVAARAPRPITVEIFELSVAFDAFMPVPGAA